jgi:NhaP-type Na+/H+ or K+/H+ antiporter
MKALLRFWRGLSPAFRGVLLCVIGLAVSGEFGFIADASHEWWSGPIWLLTLLVTIALAVRVYWVLLSRPWSANSGTILEYIKTRRGSAPRK